MSHTVSTTPGRILAPVATLLAVVLTLAFAGPALADTSSSLTVVGTSDVSDSGLVQNLIQPDFQKAYPQYTFKYIGTATGTAISDAESGSQGASALIVHAKSLENQFVSGGYSYERYGRAIFTNDFVLAGPKADPAGVGSGGAHDIARAFASVAAAGINGGGTPKATFVSRGGTPGTTVQEHQIWSLVAGSGQAPAGLLLCTVNATSGGGETPIAAGHGVTSSGQPCPNGGALPTASALPDWYSATGLTQGPNVIAANACTGHASGANSCYVFTDRGTYDYLASGKDGGVTVPGLTILTRDDSASAPGGAHELTNYFHAYVINPAKPGETVNLAAAQAFVNMLTSQSFQAQLKTYLEGTDAGGPPFVADASPLISAGRIPRTYRAGKPVTIKGTITNAEPGYPAIAGKPVSVDQVTGLSLIPVATTHTSRTGAFSLRFVPPVTGSYEIATGQIAQVEDASLNPVFGDILSPAATTPVKVTVHSAVTKLFARSLGGRALVFGSVSPGVRHLHAGVTVYARHAGHGRYRKVAFDRLGSSDGNFATIATLAPGAWQLKVAYADRHQVIGATSKTIRVTVGPRPSASTALRQVTVRKGRVTATGAIRPAAAHTGVTIRLVALKLTGGAPRFGQLAARTVRGGTGVRLSAGLRGTGRWAVELVSSGPGRAPSASGLRVVTVR